jgi:hypothetical protein
MYSRGGSTLLPAIVARPRNLEETGHAGDREGAFLQLHLSERLALVSDTSL